MPEQGAALAGTAAIVANAAKEGGGGLALGAGGLARATSKSPAPVAMRSRTLLEIQPYLLAYGFGISLFSPTASLYQLLKLNPSVVMTPSSMVKTSMRILPHQTLLKMAQMTVSTPVKEHLNPWAAFAVVGVLQGGVYGQSTVFFSQHLGIGTKASYKGMFRGVAFAGARDMVSQGAPFVFSPYVREHLLDPIYPTDDPSSVAAQAKQWISVLGCSVAATFASQGLHNCQLTMQSNQNLSYAGAISKAWGENGIKLLYRGGEARVGLLLIVNIFNELIIKPAWEKVPE